MPRFLTIERIGNDLYVDEARVVLRGSHRVPRITPALFCRHAPGLWSDLANTRILEVQFLARYGRPLFRGWDACLREVWVE